MNIEQILELNNIESNEENIAKYSSLLDEDKVLLIDSSNIILSEDTDPDYFYMQLLNNNNLELSENNLLVLKEALNNHSVLLFEDSDDEKKIALDKARKFKNIGKRVAATVAGAALGGAALGTTAAAIGGKVEGNNKYNSDMKDHTEAIEKHEQNIEDSKSRQKSHQKEIDNLENSSYTKTAWEDNKDYSNIPVLNDLQPQIDTAKANVDNASKALAEYRKSETINPKKLTELETNLKNANAKLSELNKKRDKYIADAKAADKASHYEKEKIKEDNFNANKKKDIDRHKTGISDEEKYRNGETDKDGKKIKDGENDYLESAKRKKADRAAEGNNMYIGKKTKIAAGVSAGAGVIGGGIAGNLLAKKSNESEDDESDRLIEKERKNKEEKDTLKSNVTNAENKQKEAETKLKHTEETEEYRRNLALAQQSNSSVQAVIKANAERDQAIANNASEKAVIKANAERDQAIATNTSDKTIAALTAELKQAQRENASIKEIAELKSKIAELQAKQQKPQTKQQTVSSKKYKVKDKNGKVVKTYTTEAGAKNYIKKQPNPSNYTYIVENYIFDILNINNPNNISFNENINEDYFFMQLLDANGFKANKNNLHVFKEAWYNGNVLFKNNEQYIIKYNEEKEGNYMYTNQIKQILDENGFLPTDDNVDILMDELIENQTLILYDDDIMLEEDSDPDYFFMQLLDKNGYKVNKNNINIIKESFDNGRILLTESSTLTKEEQDEAINRAKAKKQAEEDKKVAYIEKGEKKDAKSSKTKAILKTLGAIGLGALAGGALGAGGVGAAEGIGTLANSDIATKIANNRELVYGGATAGGAAAGALGAGAAKLTKKHKKEKKDKEK